MTVLPILSEGTVTLRQHREADVPRVVEACSDPETSYWLGTLPSPYTEDHARTFLESHADQVRAGDAAHWVVADAGTDLLIGSVSLMDLASGSGPEVGYWAHPDARGRGLLTQAVRLAVRQAFAPVAEGGLGFGKLRLESALGNTASRRVAEKTGFSEVGLQRAAIICRDGLHDAMRYVLLVSDIASEIEPVEIT